MIFKAAIASLALVLTPSLSSLLAADVSVTVYDSSGKTADHAVVTLSPLFEGDMPSAPAAEAVMRQENTMFHPFVLPVSTGTSVSFPNLDEFRHHVYSFSKAKRLELRLYGKDESNEILFDKSGVVALGCNIHDNMLAYIFVTDDPYYTVTDKQGQATFVGLKAGRYKMSVWHPDQKSKKEVFSQEVEVAETGAAVEASVTLRSVRRRQKGPDGKEYN